MGFEGALEHLSGFVEVHVIAELLLREAPMHGSVEGEAKVLEAALTPRTLWCATHVVCVCVCVCVRRGEGEGNKGKESPPHERVRGRPNLRTDLGEVCVVVEVHGHAGPHGAHLNDVERRKRVRFVQFTPFDAGDEVTRCADPPVCCVTLVHIRV